MKKSFSRVFLGFLGQKGPKWVWNDNFQVLWKVSPRNYWFCAWSYGKMSLKLDQSNFYVRKILFWGFWVKKDPKCAQKQFYSGIIKSQCMKLFFFYVKLQYHKDFEGKNLFSWEKRFWDKWDWSISAWNFSFFFFFNMKLQQHKSWKLGETCFGKFLFWHLQGFLFFEKILFCIFCWNHFD